jgi:hypothetical protein
MVTRYISDNFQKCNGRKANNCGRIISPDSGELGKVTKKKNDSWILLCINSYTTETYFFVKSE